MRRPWRGLVAAGLTGALLSAVPGPMATAHTAAPSGRSGPEPPPGTDTAQPAPRPGPLPPYPGPIPMPEIRPLMPPPVPMPQAQQASPRLDELRPRIALRPPIELEPR